MPISVICPACDKALKAPDSAAGKKGKCSCGNMLIIPAAASLPAVIEPQPPAKVEVATVEREPTGDFVVDSASYMRDAATDAGKSLGKTSLAVGRVAGKGTIVAMQATGKAATAAVSIMGKLLAKEPEQLPIATPVAPAPQSQPMAQYAPPPGYYPQQPQQPVTVIVNQVNSNVNTAVAATRTRPGNGAATVALVLSLLALAFCWIPIMGLLCIPLAGIAILTAGLGFLLGLMRGGAGIVGSFIAGCVALVAIIVALGSTAVLAGAAARSVPPPPASTHDSP